MRKLTRSQKKLLREWFETNKANVGFSFQAKDLPDNLYHQLEQINDTEILVQEIEGFVHDLVSEDIDKKEKEMTVDADQDTLQAKDEANKPWVKKWKEATNQE